MLGQQACVGDLDRERIFQKPLFRGHSVLQAPSASTLELKDHVMETKQVEDPQTSAPDDLLQRLSWEVKQIHGCLSEVQKCWATGLGVTVAQWNILMAISHLADDEGVRVSVVSERLAVDASFVTAQSQLLESKGLIRRKPSATDRRVVLLALSSNARWQIENLSGSMNAANAYVANNASGKAHRLLAELEELKSVLKRAKLLTASDALRHWPRGRDTA
ncbi:MAG: MarR family transcriptional regulator [Bradyrhizobium icense]|nr:MAG: MarR family transcriptional regulator [Bradyrhizobium icense]